MCLGDFGIAKDFLYTSALEHGAAFCVAGTPLYMAPEVLRGDIAGKSADTWALGCVLHEMVSPGLRAPFVADTLPALVRSIIVDPLSPLVEHAEAALGGRAQDVRLEEGKELLAVALGEGLCRHARGQPRGQEAVVSGCARRSVRQRPLGGARRGGGGGRGGRRPLL